MIMWLTSTLSRRESMWQEWDRFAGDANSPLTILCGYNDANVNYA